MDNQTKTIFVLLALIAALVGIFVLKVTGVIKPEEKEITNITKKAELLEKDETSSYEYYFGVQRKQTFREKLIYFIIRNYTKIIIAIYIFSIFINIGTGKLYKKLSMPEWTVNYQYMYPFIMIISGLLFRKINIINTIVSLTTLIISVGVMSHYFRSVGMSKFWPLLGPAVVLPIIGLSISSSLSSSLFEAASGGTSSSTSEILLILAIVMIIAYILAFCVANFKVGKLFNRGIIFLIGIVILPIVFLPILGYWGEIEHISIHTN